MDTLLLHHVSGLRSSAFVRQGLTYVSMGRSWASAECGLLCAMWAMSRDCCRSWSGGLHLCGHNIPIPLPIWLENCPGDVEAGLLSVSIILRFLFIFWLASVVLPQQALQGLRGATACPHELRAHCLASPCQCGTVLHGRCASRGRVPVQ